MGSSKEPNVVYAKDVKAVTASISQQLVMRALSIRRMLLQAGDTVEIAAVTPADSHDPVIYLSVLLRNMIMLWLRFLYIRNEPRGQKVLEKYGFSTSK